MVIKHLSYQALVRPREQPIPTKHKPQNINNAVRILAKNAIWVSVVTACPCIRHEKIKVIIIILESIPNVLVLALSPEAIPR